MSISRLAARWLNQRCNALASERAVFKRGDLSIPIRVRRGERIEEEAGVTSGGFRERVVCQDFLVSASELDERRDTAYWTSRIWRRTEQPPIPVTPQSGDRIVIGDETYELAPRDERPCAKSSDAAGSILRLHTIRITKN